MHEPFFRAPRVVAHGEVSVGDASAGDALDDRPAVIRDGDPRGPASEGAHQQEARDRALVLYLVDLTWEAVLDDARKAPLPSPDG